jgi:hypothetical protein
MNERIKEFLTPKLKEWGGASGDNFSEELEKFAELIVKECMRVVGNKTCPNYAYKAIRTHFGVEE